MISKDLLLTIKDLNLSGKVEQMSNLALAEYTNNLDEFVNHYPTYEEELKRAFSTKDNNAFSQTLLSLRNILSLLHADELVQGCLKLLGEINAGRQSVTEAYFTYFMTALSALSIDIQVAQHKGLLEGKPAERAPTPAAEPEKGPTQKLILAVDDMSMILSGLNTVFQGTHFKFAGVTSAMAALQFIQNHTPDLFLLDIEMPEMDGYELAARIRKCGHTAPIIFLTGNSSKEYVIKALSAGAADFIVKPINREQVLGKVIKFTL